MSKFTFSVETDDSGEIASLAVLSDLCINGDAAKMQPVQIQQAVDLLLAQFVEYTWSDRGWSEEDVKILANIWEMLAREALGFREDGPWSEDKEELTNA